MFFFFFYLSFNFDFNVSKIMHLWVCNLLRGPDSWVSGGRVGAGGGNWSAAGWLGPPVVLVAGRPGAALLFRFFGDFVCRALLFLVTHVVYKYRNR